MIKGKAKEININGININNPKNDDKIVQIPLFSIPLSRIGAWLIE